MCSKRGLIELREACDHNDDGKVAFIGKKCGYPTAKTVRDCSELQEHLEWLLDPSGYDYEHSLDYKGKRFEKTGRPLNQMLETTLGDNCVAGDLYLPVVRYVDPEGKGIYYGKEPSTKIYCGLYYFYEPNATTFLNLGKTLITASKVNAFLTLWEDPIAKEALLREIPPQQQYEEYWKTNVEDVLFRPKRTKREFPIVYQRMKDFPVVVMVNKTGKKTTRVNPQSNHDYFWIYSGIRYDEYLRIYQTIVNTMVDSDNMHDFSKPGAVRSWHFQVEPDDLPPPSHFKILLDLAKGDAVTKNLHEYYVEIEVDPLYYDLTGEYSGNAVMGFFDPLDQPICVMARAIGLDTVILQHEPGETRPVTEVLDMRLKEQSYASICRVDHSVDIGRVEDPTIWLPSEGLYTYDADSDSFEVTYDFEI